MVKMIHPKPWQLGLMLVVLSLVSVFCLHRFNQWYQIAKIQKSKIEIVLPEQGAEIFDNQEQPVSEPETDIFEAIDQAAENEVERSQEDLIGNEVTETETVEVEIQQEVVTVEGDTPAESVEKPNEETTLETETSSEVESANPEGQEQPAETLQEDLSVSETESAPEETTENAETERVEAGVEGNQDEPTPEAQTQDSTEETSEVEGEGDFLFQTTSDVVFETAVIDNAGEALPGVKIEFKSLDSTKMFAQGITNEEGRFAMKVPMENRYEQVRIDIIYPGYKWITINGTSEIVLGRSDTIAATIVMEQETNTPETPASEEG